MRVPTYQPHALEFQVCERDVFKVALRADHPLAKRRRLSLATLAHEPLIGYGLAKVPGMQALVALAFQSVGLMPRITQEANLGLAITSRVDNHNPAVLRFKEFAAELSTAAAR